MKYFLGRNNCNVLERGLGLGISKPDLSRPVALHPILCLRHDWLIFFFNVQALTIEEMFTETQHELNLKNGDYLDPPNKISTWGPGCLLLARSILKLKHYTNLSLQQLKTLGAPLNTKRKFQRIAPSGGGIQVCWFVCF